MSKDRDFLYMNEITSFRCFVTDDKRFGLHLVKANGETIDIVFCREAHPDLERLGAQLNNHLLPKR